jgi:zinc protease
MFGGLPLLGALNQARERVRPTPRGGRKGGRIEHIEATKLDEVRARWRDHYKPANALLVLAGAVEVEAASKLIKDLFSPLPAGKPLAAPGEPGKPRAGKPEVIEAAFRVKMPAEACLAWAAPAPDDPRYAAFLVLAARLTRDSSKLKAGPGRFPVSFRLLDDPAVVTVSVPLGKDETDEQALKRLREFVDAGLAPQFSDADTALVRGFYGTFLGFGGVPDFVLAQNLYGLAFALGRREQMGIDPEKLLKAVVKVNEDDLRRVAGEVFGKERQAGVVLRPREK